MAPSWKKIQTKRSACVDRHVQLTFADTIYLSIGTGLLIPTTREHGDRLLLIPLFLSKVV